MSLLYGILVKNIVRDTGQNEGKMIEYKKGERAVWNRNHISQKKNGLNAEK